LVLFVDVWQRQKRTQRSVINNTPHLQVVMSGRPKVRWTPKEKSSDPRCRSLYDDGRGHESFVVPDWAYLILEFILSLGNGPSRFLGCIRSSANVTTFLFPTQPGDRDVEIRIVELLRYLGSELDICMLGRSTLYACGSLSLLRVAPASCFAVTTST